MNRNNDLFFFTKLYQLKLSTILPLSLVTRCRAFHCTFNASSRHSLIVSFPRWKHSDFTNVQFDEWIEVLSSGNSHERTWIYESSIQNPTCGTVESESQKSLLSPTVPFMTTSRCQSSTSYARLRMYASCIFPRPCLTCWISLRRRAIVSSRLNDLSR